MRTKHFVAAPAFALLLLALGGRSAAAQRTAGDGFLFGAPRVGFTIRLGYEAPTAGSDLFSFVTNELSLRRSDFGSYAYGADFAVAVRPQLSVVVSGDFGGMDKKSDYRLWQDNAGLPIEQTTSFSRQSYVASLRYYFRPYGRSLSTFAWVPTRLAPWVSAGVGRTHYTFAQKGDFVDFTNSNRVFTDSYSSEAWGATALAAAGLDWSISPRLTMTTQARYLWGRADLGLDFSGFAPIDLSAFGLTGGLTIRF
jgi:hypothetical protein